MGMCTSKVAHSESENPDNNLDQNNTDKLIDEPDEYILPQTSGLKRAEKINKGRFAVHKGNTNLKLPYDKNNIITEKLEKPDEYIIPKKSSLERAEKINKERFAVHKGNINVKLPNDASSCVVTGVVVLPNGDIVIVDQNNKTLKLFAYKLHYKADMVVMDTPESACGVPKQSHIFVTFPELCRIWRIGICNGIPMMQKKKTIETKGRCTAICSNKFGGLAVTVKANDIPWQVHLINDHGDILKQIHGGTLFLSPTHITVTLDLNIIVLDKANNRTYYVTPEGQIIFVYKDLPAPVATCTDNKANIFLLGAHGLHQIDNSGNRVKKLLSKVDIGIAPICMSYRDTDVHEEVLVTAGRNDNVKVYVVLDEVTGKTRNRVEPNEKFRKLSLVDM